MRAIKERAGPATVRALLEQGAYVDQTLLLSAAQNGDAEVVRALLDGGADANKASTDKAVTPLLWEIGRAHV